MTVLRVLIVVVLLANCAMLVKLTTLMREWVAGNERRAHATPDAAAVVLTSIARLDGKIDRLLEGGVRIEAAAAVVAGDLVDSHDRADATNGPPGTAADAAMQTGETA